jgi:hypothetical protein
LAVEALGLAEVDWPVTAELVEVLVRDRDVLRDEVLGRAELVVERLVVRDFVAVRGLLVLVVEDRVADDRRAVEVRRVAGRRADEAAVGFAVDMVFAAAVSAFAAAVMDLVAVFIACIADDIVLADVVALVAAAFILVAAEVTLVAADDTVRAAVAGVAELRAELRVERDAVRRAAVLRVVRADVLLVDRADVLRVDRDAGFREVDEAVPAGLAAVLRRAVDLARVEALLAFGRLAVPDALRLTDLLRAVLAELRRVAARVVV